MLKPILAIVVISLSASLQAVEQNTSTHQQLLGDHEKAAQAYADSVGKTAPQVTHYRYGMKLDIGRVIASTETDNGCYPAPAQMTYEDSNGELHILQYHAFGASCSN